MYMEKNIDELLNVLSNSISENNMKYDVGIINQVIDSLIKLKNSSINETELENIEKNIIFLETKYDEFNELSNYFDPIYISIKNEFHAKKVNDIRKENKKKREGK